MRMLPIKIYAPVLCIAILSGMLVQQSTYTTPKQAEPYHQRAKAAVEAVPWIIGSYAAVSDDLPAAAVKLLKPNVYLMRKYVDSMHPDRTGQLLIVQCKESRDMVGHYPKNCYPSSGFEMASAPAPFARNINGLEINATQYYFRRTKSGHTVRQCVYNFLIVPGVGILPDIEGVERAAEDYQQRYFGAAQYQVVLNADLPAEQREAIFDTLIAANTNAINVLLDGGIR